MNPSAQALTDYMSELSEAAYSAAWMQGLEFALWKAVTKGSGHYGRLHITADHISKLRKLSDACGGWIVFDAETEETLVDLGEWRKIYSDQITSMQGYTT